MKKKIIFLVFVGGLFLINNSCSDDLEIKNDYGFTITHLPVPKRLKAGETAEIRFELVSSGRYADAKYFVRFFQFDGKGSLTFDGQTLIPNDSYELKNESFRMYYTSQCEEQKSISLTFFDNFRNQVELSFSFSHDSKEEQ
jgi:hypothetical protein